MGTPLVPIALAGAAIFLLSSGKKRGGQTASGFSYKPLPKGSIPQVYGGLPPSGNQSTTTWIQRQEALTALSNIEFLSSSGQSIPLCSKCDPKGVDGKPGKNTLNAVKAFQALAGLDPTGEWKLEEDRAMHKILSAVSQGIPIECDPLVGYPAPFACFTYGDGFALRLQEGATAPAKAPSPSAPKPKPAPTPSGEPVEYGPDELLVADAECNYILHQDDKWFTEQNRRVIEYALDGMTDVQAAEEIHESMLADYIPLCLSLGYSGIGPGVKQFWDVNLAHVVGRLKGYELLPETLEEDAIKYGLL